MAETSHRDRARPSPTRTRPSSYSTEHARDPRRAASSITAPGAATGRRKEAIARVRIVPGTGTWKINGRTLEEYFPNKVHQQLVNEPVQGRSSSRAATT